MHKEIEIKFKIENVESMKRKLLQAGAIFIEKPYEQTTYGYFSTDSMTKGIFPRIRNEKDKIVFTVKVKKDQQPEYKERMEYSMNLDSIDQGENILFALGYDKVRVFTKIRQEYTLLNTKITIDELYFGIFLEIEGEKMDIEKVINNLALKDKERITKAYLSLEDDYKKSNSYFKSK